MQDFLAGGGKRLGDYTELQVGPAPTQMQNFPVPAFSITEWTEWYSKNRSLFIFVGLEVLMEMFKHYEAQTMMLH